MSRLHLSKTAMMERFESPCCGQVMEHLGDGTMKCPRCLRWYHNSGAQVTDASGQLVPWPGYDPADDDQGEQG